MIPDQLQPNRIYRVEFSRHRKGHIGEARIMRGERLVAKGLTGTEAKKWCKKLEDAFWLGFRTGKDDTP